MNKEYSSLEWLGNKVALVEASCRALSTFLCCAYWSRARSMDTRSVGGWQSYRKIGFLWMKGRFIHAFTEWKRRDGFVLKPAVLKTTGKLDSIPSPTQAWSNSRLSKKDGSSISAPSVEF
jgi:hypothetical protein